MKDLQLTPEEQQLIVENRKKIEEKKQKELQQKYEYYLKTYDSNFNITVNKNKIKLDGFYELLKSKSDLFSIKVKKTNEIFKSSLPLPKDFKLKSYEKVEVILIAKLLAGAREFEIDIIKGQKLKIVVPYELETTNRYNNVVIISTFIKKIENAIKQRNDRMMKKLKFDKDLNEKIASLKKDLPNGTKFETGTDIKYHNYRRRSDFDRYTFLRISYPNGNMLELRVSNDMSMSVIKKIDMTTKNFKSNDWINYLK